MYIKMDQITYRKVFSSVLISIVYPNVSSAYTNIKSNSKVFRLEWHVWSILFVDNLSLEESSLWGSTVDLLWFSDQDWSVFQEIVQD